MGIRFYCPNGHRLHVKSFLAGKRGICPHCTARFRIPPDSEIPRGSPKIKPDSGAAANPKSKRQLRPVATTAPSESSVEEKPKLAQFPSDGNVSPSGDPIAEAPEAVWYVRPPSGGQYGPAKGDVMRRWLAEGRVSADSLVWREGWSDWLTAGPLFPMLVPNHAAAPTTASSTAMSTKRETVSLQLQPVPSESASGNRAGSATARTATPQKSLAPVIILVLTVVVLLVVLVFVISTRT